jgi:hypothetical protein
MNELTPTHPAFATPMNMLDRAIASGAPMEMVEKLMALVERREANEARKAFEGAMAAAAAELPAIVKSKLVDFTSAKGRTRYRYESLDDVVDTVRPVLGKHGLSFRFQLKEDEHRLTVTCRVVHADGHGEECTLSAPRDESGQKNYIQSKGSTITYLQRYTLKAALGLAASVDDDGATSATGATPVAPVARISAEQAAQLTALISDIKAGGVRDALLGRVKAESLEAIPADLFERAVTWLRKVKQAEAVGTAEAAAPGAPPPNEEKQEL